MSVAHSFDVIVVGAGMAGASVAANLAPRQRVLVLESEPHPGVHATGRSAAIYSRTYGNRPIRALTQASWDFLATPPEGFSAHPLTRPRGSLVIAATEQVADLEEYARLPDVVSVAQRVRTDEALRLCPLLRPEAVAAGLYEPQARDIDVDGLHKGYLRQLRACEGSLLLNHAATRLEQLGSSTWRVVAADHVFEAPVVINACGAWADRLALAAGLAPLSIQPKRRSAALVDAPIGVDPSPWPLVIDFEERFYFKPDAGLLLLSPADETPTEPCDAYPDEWDIAVAVERVQRVTTLDVRRVRRSWAGLRTFAPDRTPVIGFDSRATGFFWLAGLGGYGIQTAPAVGRSAAELIVSGRLPDDIAAYGLTPEVFEPGRFGRESAFENG
jgi:D-arginine dehydrogenase